MPTRVRGAEDAELILVIDDDEDMRRVVALTLTPRFRVAATGDANEALRVMRRQRPRLVLLDLRIPGVDTRALLCRLREAAPSTPILMLTGDQDVGHAREMLGVGAVLYLTKPFEPLFLREEIARLLDRTPAADKPPWRLEDPDL